MVQQQAVGIPNNLKLRKPAEIIKEFCLYHRLNLPPDMALFMADNLEHNLLYTLSHPVVFRDADHAD